MSTIKKKISKVSTNSDIIDNNIIINNDLTKTLIMNDYKSDVDDDLIKNNINIINLEQSPSSSASLTEINCDKNVANNYNTNNNNSATKESESSKQIKLLKADLTLPLKLTTTTNKQIITTTTTTTLIKEKENNTFINNNKKKLNNDKDKDDDEEKEEEEEKEENDDEQDKKNDKDKIKNIDDVKELIDDIILTSIRNINEQQQLKQQQQNLITSSTTTVTNNTPTTSPTITTTILSSSSSTSPTITTQQKKLQENFRKKFYESDDTIINQIFSQTITSAGVTPTDDDYEQQQISFTNIDNKLINDTNTNTNTNTTTTTTTAIQYNKNCIVEHDINSLNNIDDTLAGPSSMDNTNTISHESQTENLDNYIENDILLSLNDNITITDQTYDDDDDDNVINNDDYENITNNQTEASSLNEFDNNIIDDDLTNIDDCCLSSISKNKDDCDIIRDDDEINIKNNLTKKSRPSIVVDCYDDDSKRIEPYYVEPVTPKKIKSYFDTTIDDDTFVQINDNTNTNTDTDINIIDNKIIIIDDVPIDFDYSNIELYKTTSSTNIDKQFELNKYDDSQIINFNSKIYLDEDLITSGSDESSNSSNGIEGVAFDSVLTHHSSVAAERVIENESTSIITTTQTTTTSSTSSSATAEVTTTKTDKAIKKKSDSTGKKKTKKTKKSDPEKENISVKSSFSKFDALQKKNILHVRSSASGKAQEKFNGITGQEAEKNCRACGKVVFQMEQMKAEKNIWHKNCFRCSECSKQLNVDTYQSHESILYCKPHFKALFTPKAVEDNEPTGPKKPEMIIRENQPVELPPDVFRASDKPDLGLEELQSLNVKERFQVFENAGDTQDGGIPIERSSSSAGVKRSASILSKLARFQAKGMNIGITDESLNGIPLEHSSSENEEDIDDDDDVDLIRAKRVQKERPMSFSNMNEMKTKFESGHSMTKEERREERKQEIQNIRSRLFLGKQAKIKEMYQQAVLESEQGVTSTNKKHDIDIGDKARSIMEKFEKGEVYNRTNEEKEEEEQYHSRMQEEEQAVFEQGISKKSRSIFLEMDATTARNPNVTTPVTPTPRTPEARKNSQVSPLPVDKRKPFLGEDVIKCDEKLDDIKIETAEISSKFKFFETYKPEEKQKKQFRITPPRDGVVKDGSPDREVYRDPDVIRGDGQIDDPTVAQKSHTATKMLSIFRQMEEDTVKEPQYEGLKPLKRFTPPPDEGRRTFNDDDDSDRSVTDEEDEEEEEEEEEESIDEQPNADHISSANKFEDEFLKQAQSAERAKQLRAKFERWETNEIKREQNNSSVNLYDGNDESQVESAKSIRAKFESMREPGQQDTRERVKVNRFV